MLFVLDITAEVTCGVAIKRQHETRKSSVVISTTRTAPCASASQTDCGLIYMRISPEQLLIQLWSAYLSTTSLIDYRLHVTLRPPLILGRRRIAVYRT